MKNIIHGLSTESTYGNLARAIVDLKLEIDGHAAFLKEYGAQLKILQEKILPEKLDAEGVSTVNVKGLGRLTNSTQTSVTTVAAHKYDLQKWLMDNGYEALITEVVNSSTLKAFVKECLSEGTEFPMDYVNMHSFDRVTLTKK